MDSFKAAMHFYSSDKNITLSPKIGNHNTILPSTIYNVDIETIIDREYSIQSNWESTKIYTLTCIMNYFKIQRN